MSAARILLERARAAGLAPELADALDRDLAPRLETFLSSVPDLPPANAQEETRLLVGLVEIHWPHVPALAGALERLIDGASIGLDDLLDRSLQGDEAKRRSLHHLEAALASLVRIGSAVAALIARHPQLGRLTRLHEIDATALVIEIRPYLRGALSTLVGLQRMGGTSEQLAPWAWMARRETLKIEGLFLLELQKLDHEPAAARPRRVPGDLKELLLVTSDQAFHAYGITVLWV